MNQEIENRTVVLADGEFPRHEIPLGFLEACRSIVCCDGSVSTLLEKGYLPDAIVGDMDSITEEIAERFADRIYKDSEQETNDLTKAVTWCIERGYNDLVIIGATGKREDHTLGNISLLADYSSKANVIMVTDTGIFRAYHQNAVIDTVPGQQVSVFSFDPAVRITSEGLAYPLKGKQLTRWWQATLNEATGKTVRLSFSGGPVLVFLKFT